MSYSVSIEGVSVENAQSYAEAFIDQSEVEQLCQEACDRIMQEVSNDLYYWKVSRKNLSEYQITYGTDNFLIQNNFFGLKCIAERSIFPRVFDSDELFSLSQITVMAKGLWNRNKLSVGSRVIYYDYEKECQIAVVRKIRELLQDKFTSGSLTQQIVVGHEFRGYFGGEADDYLRLKKGICCCVCPVFGWAVVAVDQSSQYNGEALIRIASKEIGGNE